MNLIPATIQFWNQIDQLGHYFWVQHRQLFPFLVKGFHTTNLDGVHWKRRMPLAMVRNWTRRFGRKFRPGSARLCSEGWWMPHHFRGNGSVSLQKSPVMKYQSVTLSCFMAFDITAFSEHHLCHSFLTIWRCEMVSASALGLQQFLTMYQFNFSFRRFR